MLCLGIDTSNYTTSFAFFNADSCELKQYKMPLAVKEGALGLRQSDAVFEHVKNFVPLFKNVTGENAPLKADFIGVSTTPRRAEGSYMPCFLVGSAVAAAMQAVTGAQVFEFSHQEGHIAAAAYSAGVTHLITNQKPFLAFHFSGGTTECLYCKAENGHISAEIISATSDLNAGQLVDRVGGALGFSFPAGKQLEAAAVKSTQNYENIKPTFVGGNPAISGVENKAMQMLANGEKHEDIALYTIKYLQNTAKKMLENAHNIYGELPVVFSGGVMSNRIIAAALGGENRFFAEPAFSADNAAGTAILAYLKGSNLL